MSKFDTIILGAGPGGYVAAIRLAQLGKKVAIVEKRKTLGGTCLNVGCIPSKALLDSSEHYLHTQEKLKDHGIEVSGIKLNLNKLMQRKDQVVSEITQGIDFLIKKNKITRYLGTGSFKSANIIEVVQEKSQNQNQNQSKAQETQEIQADHIVIATGSEPIELKDIPINGKNIITSDHAIRLEKVPKHLMIIGAGVVGLELGSVWKRLGSEVTIIEFMPGLMGTADRQMARFVERTLSSQGLKFLFGHEVIQAKDEKGIVKVTAKDQNQKEVKLEGDILLVAVGRKPVVENLKLGNAGITLTPKNRIEVNPSNFQTKTTHIYAIGDVIDGPMLAHKASEEGVAVAEFIAGGHGHVNYESIPWVIYTWPEIAWVGYGEEELKEKGIEYKVGRSIFQSNGRAKAMNEVEGQVKILSDKNTDKIIGIYIVGPRASEMISEAVIAFEFGGSAEDIARSIHAHPTLAEVIKEAAMDVDKWAIHS